MIDCRRGEWKTSGGLAALALVAAAILGYHPFSEDGGIYLAEIKRALNPQLYPLDTPFVAGHLQWSAFTAAVVWVVKTFGWHLDWVLVGLHLLCIQGLIIGVWHIARQCYPNAAQRWGAVGMVALCLTMPLAGTSLLLLDPYVTARSVCLTLTVLGTAGTADYLAGAGPSRAAYSLTMLVLAALVHPLMAGYWIAAVIALLVVLDRRPWVRVGGVLALAFAAWIVAISVQLSATPETANYKLVAATRYYWFLSEWHWFELLGLAAPLAILGWFGWKRANNPIEASFARMAACVGGIGVAIALLFARKSVQVYAVARMQPLRCFQVVYIIMLVVLGSWVGERLLRHAAWRWSMALLTLGGVMFYVERTTYPASEHFELPGFAVENRWEQAFSWARDHTPRQALFALDADYVHQPGEDAQLFRAVAERSVLPDYSKDGGQAAIRPELTEAWLSGQKAQANLTGETDTARIHALRSLGVTWIVIGREAVTVFDCPYENARVKVCRLP